MNVLILGGRSFVSYKLARILYNNNHTIYTGDSVKFFITRSSKYVKASFILPHVNTELDNYIKVLNDIVLDYKIDIIYPTCEEVFYLSIIKDKISTNIYTAEFHIIEKLHSKYEFIKLCSTLDIKVPRTNIINDDNYLKDFKLPVIIKGIYSRFSNNIDIIKNSDDKKLYKKNKYIIQEYIEGYEVSSYSMCDNGRVLITALYKNEIRNKNGPALVYKQIYNEEIEIIIESIVKNLGYNGQIGFDFIVTDKGIYPIECNPRCTSGIMLIDDSYKIGDIKKYSNEQVGIKLMLLNNYKEFIKSKDIVYDKKDMKPFINKIVMTLYFIYKSIILNKSLTEVTTYDIEYNGDIKSK